MKCVKIVISVRHKINFLVRSDIVDVVILRYFVNNRFIPYSNIINKLPNFVKQYDKLPNIFILVPYSTWTDYFLLRHYQLSQTGTQNCFELKDLLT